MAGGGYDSPQAGGASRHGRLEPLMRAYKSNGEQWSGSIATAIAKQSIAGWLDQIENRRSPISRKATAGVADLRATATFMRGFFLADPNELSLLPYVEQFAAGDDPAKRTMYRLREGNDRLPQRMARMLHAPIRLQHIARRIVQNENRVAKSL